MRYGLDRPIRPSGSVRSAFGSPVLRDLGRGSSAWAQLYRSSRPTPPQAAQEGRSREKMSLSRRSPEETPAFASSPTSSAAEAASSAPPGGGTVPLIVSPSDSKPCLGAASGSDPLAGLLASLRFRLPAGALAGADLRPGVSVCVLLDRAPDERPRPARAGSALARSARAPSDRPRSGPARPAPVRGRG